MEIINKILEKGEYYQDVFPKTSIYIHHTAGGHRPDWVISGWDSDDTLDAVTKKKKARIVATAFVIGGISTTDGDEAFNGKVYRAFDESFWAHHLGTEYINNGALNKASIGIEICNYGPLKYNAATKQYFNYVNKPVPAEQVITLAKPFRGYQHYHAYTDEQIKATKDLIILLKQKFPSISLKSPLVNVAGFEFDVNAKRGVPGLYSHSNIRLDKFDLSPQPNIINMIKELATL